MLCFGPSACVCVWPTGLFMAATLHCADMAVTAGSGRRCQGSVAPPLGSPASDPLARSALLPLFVLFMPLAAGRQLSRRHVKALNHRYSLNLEFSTFKHSAVYLFFYTSFHFKMLLLFFYLPSVTATVTQHEGGHGLVRTADLHL